MGLMTINISTVNDAILKFNKSGATWDYEVEEIVNTIYTANMSNNKILGAADKLSKSILSKLEILLNTNDILKIRNTKKEIGKIPILESF